MKIRLGTSHESHLRTTRRVATLAAGAALSSVLLTGVCCVKHDPPRGPNAVSGAQNAPSSDPTMNAVTANAQTQELFEGFALTQPDELHELPSSLIEISGLTDLSDTEVGCVQDEEGDVFIYDLPARQVTTRIHFAEPGDYEGLTRVGTTLFVLRSDGVLFEIANYATERKVSRRDLKIPARDIEGLCYDPTEDRLLIAPKSRLGKTDDARQSNWLFAYDLKKQAASSEPVIRLDLSQVLDGREKVRETKHGRKRVLPSRFLPSSVTVNPVNGDLWVLSAVASNLALFDRSGNLLRQHPLDKELLPQPEGITFLPNGDLVIVSEGAGKKGTLALFRRKAAPK